MNIRRKLIEVALPLEAINKAAAREKQPGIGAHPRGLHLWWARRPLAAARAVIFAQMVDDPSAWPDLFKTEKAQENERKRLFDIIEELVKWENTANERVLGVARDEIWRSWRRTCADNADHIQAKELFDRNVLPAFHDPFAGGGALPLEAQRLGLESHASDLNPVAVLINKAMIEIPPKFAGLPPINPEWQSLSLEQQTLRQWKGAQGLAADVRYYGEWMRRKAEERIGHLYPKVEITKSLTAKRPDLEPYIGRTLPVIAWLWARTVKSPDPAFAEVDVPLASNFMLSTKPGKEAYVKPLVKGNNYSFEVKIGKAEDRTAGDGTKLGRGANFRCLMSGSPIPSAHIYSEALAGRMGVRLMAIIADGGKGRLYLDPSEEQEMAAKAAIPDWKPEVEMPANPRWFSPPLYGFKTFGDLFTNRQLLALNTFSNLIANTRAKILLDCETALLPGDGVPLVEGGLGSAAYADALSVYLSFAIDRLVDYNSSIATWKPSGEQVMQTYKRQAMPMTWDFPESNVLGESAICWKNAVKYAADNLEMTYPNSTGAGYASQEDAATQSISRNKVVSSDPPYYDNIGYADLSDFFYVWLRKSIRSVFGQLFATLAVPKDDELVATPYRHGGTENAERFFLDGMRKAMRRIEEQAHIAFPVTIYYAFKQSETEDAEGTSSTGWETFLGAVIEAGLGISGTWPMRTELANRMISSGTNALASSIILVCRKRAADAPIATRREFVQALEAELAPALRNLQEGNIAPVDLAQAAIGPGMAVYTRFAKVLDATGNSLTVKQALELINERLDAVLAEQEGDFGAETRWALSWFDQVGFSDGEYGLAETLSKAKNTSVNGMVDAGILVTKSGKVRLLRPEELLADWEPSMDTRLPEWEVVHQLIRALNAGGEIAAANLVSKLGHHADTARELAYRLYVLCERKKRAQDALTYNALVQSWPEIQRLAVQQQNASIPAQQSTMFR